MPVNLIVPSASDVHDVPGLRLGVAQAGIRKPNRKDLLVMILDAGASVAAVFTTNRFSAAPVEISRRHLRLADSTRALVVNTGVANAGTGAEGLKHAAETCVALAGLLGCPAEAVLPFSTGVIMEPLPVERIMAALPAAVESSRPGNWLSAAEAIMTTDTLPKVASTRVMLGGTAVTVTGISKGAGMVRPNMATILGFVATDAKIAPALLQTLTTEVADSSFNRISVEGDTSTNDSFVLISTQQASNEELSSLETPDGKLLVSALKHIAVQLAQAIVRDGEGATKFVTVRVEGGNSKAECLKVAYAIANSPLVKTALFASDPNLGRILAAVGYAGIDDLSPDSVDLYIGDMLVASRGARSESYSESEAERLMRMDEVLIRVSLGRGAVVESVWTCDLSHDFVTLNASYRS